MFANEEAPELQSVSPARQCGLRHDQLVTDGALNGAIQDSDQLAIVETAREAHPVRVPLHRNGLQ
eukprot:8751500-Alexandrium_andersonii.AAC.1